MLIDPVLSSTLAPVEGHLIGQHPVVFRLMQGMFNTRPPEPRYRHVWNVTTVVDFIRLGPPTLELPLKDLAKRLVMLLASCSAGRASDLRALDFPFILFTGNTAKCSISGLTKTRKSGPPREIISSVFNGAENLVQLKP